MKRAGRRSLISGIMALSLVLAGTGYAYWTDTLQVTTKATTGNFGVTFVDLGLYAQYGNEILNGGWSIVDGIDPGGYADDEFFMRGSSDYNAIAAPGSIEKYKERQFGYSNIEFDAALVDAAPIEKTVGPYNSANAKGSDKIEIKINKMYPGYAQAFRTDILNVGDIAAKLSALKFKVEADDQGNVKDMLGVALLVSREQYVPANQAHEEDVFKLAKQFGEDAVFQVGKVDFVRLSALEKADPALFARVLENNEVLCAPATDERMDLFLGIAMDPDAKGVYTTGSIENFNANGNDELSQDKAATVVIDLGWDQFNVGKDAGNPNILVKQNR